MADPAVRILVVDDSALYRQTLTHTLRELPGVEVVGSGKNGLDALARIEQLDPDLLTLDVQMPDMDGITLLREIAARRLRPRAIMVSSLTAEGAQVTTDALLEGAFDFILKPALGNPEANREYLRTQLEAKIRAYRSAGSRSASLRPREPMRSPDDSRDLPPVSAPCQIVLVGTSTGGPEALKLVLPRFPSDFPIPILVVQHMPAQFTASLASRLDVLSEVRVLEASEGQVLQPGTVSIAPGGFHMSVTGDESQPRIQLSQEPPLHGCRPAVDPLFLTAAAVFGKKTLAVVMTGMGRDGAAGAQAIKQRGGQVFAQHEDGCSVYGMPKAVVDLGLADRVLPLAKLAPAIVRHVKRSRRG